MSEYVFPKSKSYTILDGSGNGCDPPCDGPTYNPNGSVASCGEKCVNGNCVPLKNWGQCDLCGPLPPNHYYFLSDVCEGATNTCCAIVERQNDNDPMVRIVNVAKGDLQSLKFNGNEVVLVKDGEGTLILNDSRPLTLGTVVVNNGTVIVTTTEIFNDRSADCDLPPPKQPPGGWGDTAPPVGPPIERPFCGGVLRGSNSTLVLNPRPPVGENCNPLCVCTFGGLRFHPRESAQAFSYTSQVMPEYTGKLVIGGDTQVVIKDGTYDKTDIKNLLSLGRNDGDWNGSIGISTDYSVDGNKSLGYQINENNDMIIQFALPGDTNLDGVVDILDVSNIVSSGKYNTNSTDADWIDGDFNYDGVVDILDVSLFLSSNLYGQGNYLPQDRSYEISWTPPINTVFSSEPLRVSTSDQTEPLPYNIYGEGYILHGQEYVTVGEYTTNINCQGKAGIFDANVGNVYDGVCASTQPNQLGKTPGVGACCIGPNSCIPVIDDLDDNGQIIKSAGAKCSVDFGGRWMGYNFSCDDPDVNWCQ